MTQLQRNEFQEWPTDWPIYKNGFLSYYDRCDMLVGPCHCGAWHKSGEFELKENKLYRNGRLVEHKFDI